MKKRKGPIIGYYVPGKGFVPYTAKELSESERAAAPRKYVPFTLQQFLRLRKKHTEQLRLCRHDSVVKNIIGVVDEIGGAKTAFSFLEKLSQLEASLGIGTSERRRINNALCRRIVRIRFSKKGLAKLDRLLLPRLSGGSRWRA